MIDKRRLYTYITDDKHIWLNIDSIHKKLVIMS